MFILYIQHPFLTTIQLAIFILSFFTGTVILTPDLDTRSESSKRCGVACLPYRKIFAHRGASHHWFWGVVTRIIYVLVVIAVVGSVVWALGFGIPDVTWIVQYPFEVLMIIVGLFVANLFHIVLDTVS